MHKKSRYVPINKRLHLSTLVYRYVRLITILSEYDYSFLEHIELCEEEKSFSILCRPGLNLPISKREVTVLRREKYFI